MKRRGAIIATLLLIATQISASLFAEASSQGECVSNVYYRVVPKSQYMVCNPYVKNLTLRCSVQDQNTNSLDIDMHWFFAPGGVPQDSGTDCPSVQEEVGTMVVNDSRHTVTKQWDPIGRTLSVTLHMVDLDNSSDVGRYWCQAVLPSSGQIFSHTPSVCLRDTDQYPSFLNIFPCYPYITHSVCASLLPVPSVLPSISFTVSPSSSNIAVLSTSTVQPSIFHSLTSSTASLSPSKVAVQPYSTSASVEPSSESRSFPSSPAISPSFSLSPSSSSAPSFTASPISSKVAVLPSSIPALVMASSSRTHILSSSPTLSPAFSLISSSSSTSSTSNSINNFSNGVLSSFIVPVTSTHLRMISSSDYPHMESTVFSTSSPLPAHDTLNGYSDTVLIASVVFCAVSAVALLITATIALCVVRWSRRMQQWRAEWHVNEAAGTTSSGRGRRGPVRHTLETKTLDSSSDISVQFQVHQQPQNTLFSSPSSLQNVAINLGAAGPSSFSMGSGIYSEVGPPMLGTRNVEKHCECPPVPPRFPTSTALQENLYDIPECESIISHTYSLPDDARVAMRGSLDTLSDAAQLGNWADTARHDRVEDTGVSLFGRSSPLLVLQQRPEDYLDDILVIFPDAARRNSSLSEPSSTYTRSRNASIVWRESEDDDSSIGTSQSSSSSPTHEMVDTFLPPVPYWGTSESPEELNGSVIPPFLTEDHQSRSSSPPSASSEDALNSADLRPSYVAHPACFTVSFPPALPCSYVHTERNSASNIGSTSPAPSSSSGCTDLSKYSGDYERDPLYMEKLRQQAAPSAASSKEKDSELSSGVDSTYSPLSPIPLSPPDQEHHYTPLDHHRMNPSPVYAQPIRHPHHMHATETAV